MLVDKGDTREQLADKMPQGVCPSGSQSSFVRTLKLL